MPVKPPRIIGSRSAAEGLGPSEPARPRPAGRRPPLLAVDGALLDPSPPPTVYGRGVGRASMRDAAVSSGTAARPPVGRKAPAPAVTMRFADVDHGSAPSAADLRLLRSPIGRTPFARQNTLERRPAPISLTAETSATSALCAPLLLKSGPWKSCDPGGGGNVHSLLFHPWCPDVLFVGTDNGGLFRGVNLAGPQGSQSAWRFEPFQDGIHGWDIRGLAISPTDPDNHFYALCDGGSGPIFPDSRRQLYRWNPDADDKTPSWTHVPIPNWKHPSAPNQTGRTAGLGLVAVVPLTGTDLHLLLVIGPNSVAIQTGAAQEDEEAESSNPGSFPKRYGRIGFDTTKLSTPLSSAGQPPAAAVLARVMTGNPTDVQGPWWGSPYKTAATKTLHDVYDAYSGFGSIWVDRQGSTASSVVCYLTYAESANHLEVVAGKTIPTVEAAVVRCTIGIAPGAAAVSSITYETIVTRAQVLNALQFESKDTSAIDFAQVAGRRDSAGPQLHLYLSLVLKNEATVLKTLPRVVRVTLRGRKLTTLEIMPSLDALQLAGYVSSALKSHSNLQFLQVAADGTLVAAPAQGGNPSPEVWTLRPRSETWSRATFPYTWTKQGLTRALCFSSVLTKQELAAWRDTWLGALPSAGDNTLLDLDGGPKLLFAVGYKVSTPLRGANNAGDLAPQAMFFSLIHGETTKPTSVQFYVSEGKLQASIDQQNPGSYVSPPHTRGEPGPDGLLWNIVPVPIFAFRHLMADIAGVPESECSVGVEVRQITYYYQGTAEVRFKVLMPDSLDAGTAGCVPPPWEWPTSACLPLTFSSSCMKALIQSLFEEVQQQGSSSPESICNPVGWAAGPAAAASGIHIRLLDQSALPASTKKQNFDWDLGWSSRRRSHTYLDGAPAVWGPLHPGEDSTGARLAYIDHSSSSVITGPVNGPFAPLGSSRLGADSTAMSTAPMWRSQGLGGMWVYDFHVGPVSRGSSGGDAAANQWKERLFVCTDDGGLFYSDSPLDGTAEPVFADVDINIPAAEVVVGPDGLGPPVIGASPLSHITATTHRFAWRDGRYHAEYFVAGCDDAGHGRILLGQDNGTRWTSRVLTGLPSGPVWSMVTTAGMVPDAASKAQGVVYAAVVGHGVYVLPPGKYEWVKVGRFVRLSEDKEKLEDVPLELLEVYHLALCGDPAVLYASVSVLGFKRPFSRPPDAGDSSYPPEKLLQSHRAAGLYRLHVSTTGGEAPIGVNTWPTWDFSPDFLIWRQVAGLEAAGQQDGFGTVGDYPQAWRNIVGLAANKTGALAVAISSVRSSTFCAHAVFDGSIMVSTQAASAAYPDFRLLFTHPLPGGVALSDDGKRLFVALNSYKRMESSNSYTSSAGTSFNATVTPIHKELDSCPLDEVVDWVSVFQDSVHYANDVYFRKDDPAYGLVWPVGVFEAVNWDATANGITSIAELSVSPSTSTPGAADASGESLYLLDLTSNYAEAAQIARRLHLHDKALFVGTSGPGGYWRKV